MASGQDMKSANSTSGSFITLLKWSAPIIAVIALVVIVLISS